MKTIKLKAIETVETSSLFEFADGPVKIVERETHEIYGVDNRPTPRLVVNDAAGRTKDFVAKARAEFTELNSLLRELTAK